MDNQVEQPQPPQPPSNPQHQQQQSKQQNHSNTDTFTNNADIIVKDSLKIVINTSRINMAASKAALPHTIPNQHEKDDEGRQSDSESHSYDSPADDDLEEDSSNSPSSTSSADPTFSRNIEQLDQHSENNSQIEDKTMIIEHVYPKAQSIQSKVACEAGQDQTIEPIKEHNNQEQVEEEMDQGGDEEGDEDEENERGEEEDEEEGQSLSNQASQPESPDEHNDANREKSPESQQDIGSPPHVSSRSSRQSRSSSKINGDDNNDQRPDNSQDDASTSNLGRNKRVRQKNRYFSDFHCIDLTKGVRSREDLSYSQATTVRTSTRRSTLDSAREISGANLEPEQFETKSCRRCYMKTAHDPDSGCQVCLYRKIIRESRKLKSGSRNRSKTTSKHVADQSTSNDNGQQQRSRNSRRASSSRRRATARQTVGISKTSRSNNNNNNNNTTTTTPTTVNDRPGTSTNNLSSINETTLDNDNTNNAARLALDKTSPIHVDTDGPVTKIIESTKQLASSTTYRTSSSAPPMTSTITGGCDHDEANIKLENNNNNNNTNNNVTTDISINGTSLLANELLRLDSWSPDEVANYILANNFSLDEAELFKTQNVDGISLLLMQRTDFTYGLKLKLGPALKIYDMVCKLKREYFQRITAT